MESIPVALEIGPKRRVFAQALDWIGWCRVGKDEVSALNQLVIVGSLYAQVAERAGLTFAAPPPSRRSKSLSGCREQLQLTLGRQPFHSHPIKSRSQRLI